jgi:hypothetical protein
LGNACLDLSVEQAHAHAFSPEKKPGFSEEAGLLRGHFKGGLILAAQATNCEYPPAFLASGIPIR